MIRNLGEVRRWGSETRFELTPDGLGLKAVQNNKLGLCEPMRTAAADDSPRLITGLALLEPR